MAEASVLHLPVRWSTTERTTLMRRVECGHKFPPLAMLAHAGFLMGLDKAIVILRAPELEKGNREGRSFVPKVPVERNAPAFSERHLQ